MAIRTLCRECNAAYTLADELAGKKVRCRKCQAVIAVPDAPADAPPPRVDEGLTAEPRRSRPRVPAERRDRPRRDLDEDAVPVKKGGGGLVLGLILGGVGVALVLVLACGGAAAYFLFSGSAPTSAPVAVATTPAPQANVPPGFAPPEQNPPKGAQPQPQPNVPPGFAPPGVDPAPPAAAPENPPPAAPPDIPPVVAPPIIAPPVIPPPFVPPPPAPPPGEPAPPVLWKVQPDPLPAALKPPDDPKGEIPVGGFTHQVVFPSTPSPFVAVGAGSGINTTREVWDLRTMKRVGTVPGGGPGADPAVSPDGAQVAAAAFGIKPTVDVWTAADGGSAQVPAGDGFLKYVDFAGPGRLLTAKLAGLEVQIQVWDVKTQKEVCQFKAAADWEAKKWAFSAGRKYVAVPATRENRVLVYDLTTGEKVGELPTVGACQGLAFSDDGKSLAGLFGTPPSARLQVWDAAAGKLGAGFAVTKGVDNAVFYQGHPLEWLADGAGFALYGQLLLDAKSGEVYWRVAAAGGDNDPRRVFGAGRIAHTKNEAGKKSLVIDAPPADRLAAALAAVRNGQDLGASLLPPVTPADWSAVKELPPPAGAAEWKATADPAPAPKGALGARPIPLNGKANDLVRVLFSRPDVGQAAVLTAADKPDLIDRKQVRVDRYDLAAGKALGGADLFTAEFPKGRPVVLDADLSPDGSLLAVRQTQGSKRLDIWSVADGKYSVGFLPYEKDADPSIRWFAFTDEKHLLTLSGAGKLTRWDLPECRAAYSTVFIHDLPVLSPGRKYLAAFTGTNFEVLDTATGVRAGQLFGLNSRDVQAAAYRADGRELAAVLTTPDGARLTRWDAATGAPKGDFLVAPGGADMEWCGAGHVLLGPTLIDLTLKWPVSLCTMQGTGRPAPGGPDGRHWFAVAPTPNDPPELKAQTLPDEAAVSLAKQTAAGQVQAVLAPGTTINVRADGAGAQPDPDAFRRGMVARQSQRLAALGYKTGLDGTLTLAFRIQPPFGTGKFRRFESLGGLRREIDIPVMQVDVEATLTDANAAVLWTQKTSVQTPTTFGVVRAADLETALNRAMWNNVSGWAASVGPPGVLVRTAAGVEALPRPLLLTGDR